MGGGYWLPIGMGFSCKINNIINVDFALYSGHHCVP